VKSLARIFDRILEAMAALGCFLIIVMGCSITYGVFMRYVLNKASVWVNDLVEYIVLGFTFLGAAYVLKQESHIEVDLFVNRLGLKARVLMKIITSFIGAGIFLILSWYGMITVWDNFQRGTIVYKSVDFPKYIVLSPIFIGSVLLTIQFIRRARYYLKETKKRTAKKENDEKEAKAFEDTLIGGP
jgi:TRAP-type C4-dicarboxylate transport system permease small subunit